MKLKDNEQKHCITPHPNPQASNEPISPLPPQGKYTHPSIHPFHQTTTFHRTAPHPHQPTSAHVTPNPKQELLNPTLNINHPSAHTQVFHTDIPSNPTPRRSIVANTSHSISISISISISTLTPLSPLLSLSTNHPIPSHHLGPSHSAQSRPPGRPRSLARSPAKVRPSRDDGTKVLT